MCDRWVNSFEAFLADMGERPDGMSIERIDVNGNYEPGNCRWATMAEQARNRTSNVVIEFNGRKQVAAAWARELGLKHNKFHQLTKKKGMSVADIIRERSLAS